jgi:hypothetical protein
MWSNVVAGACLVTAWFAASAAAQTPSVISADDAESVDNRTFTDVTVTGRITEKFEIYNPHSPEQLETVRNMGFTQVILDWPNLHAAASQLGLDVVLAHWWTLTTEVKQIEQAIEYAGTVDRRKLVGFSMMDEPERYAPDTSFNFYRSLYKDLRAHFDKESPAVKVEISHWGPLASWTPARYQSFVPLYQATDRIRLMPYPDLDEGPLGEVFYQMLRSRKVMALAGRELPQVVILQTWMLPEDPKLPTIDELRVMAYCAILGGAETVSFYHYDPAIWQKTPGFSEGFASLMKELTGFCRRYRGASVESRINAAGVLTATPKPLQGPVISITVNTNRFPVDGLESLAVVGLEPSEAALVQRPTSANCRVTGPLRRWLSRRGGRP